MTITRTALAFAVLTLAAACGKEPQREAVSQAPVSVITAHARVEKLQSAFEAGGVVRPRATAVIASRLMAPIVAVHVSPGDRVRRGQVLVTLDSREISAAKTQASAAVASADDAARAALSDAQAADAQLRLARATHERMAALHAKRSATTQELDNAVAAMSSAEAQLASAKARAASATSARDAARAALEGAQVATTYAVLTAPADGVIASRSADPGSMALPGAPLLTFEDASSWRLEAQIDEARAAHVAVGQTVEVRLDTGDDTWSPARIVEIARVDPSSHSFLIKAEVAARDGLRSGVFGRVRVPGAPRRTLTAPAGALVRRGQLAFVFVANDGSARLRAVMPGAVAADRVEILAGLEDGDRVVVDPPASLTDGTPIAARTGAAQGALR